MWGTIIGLITGPFFSEITNLYKAKLASINQGDDHAIQLATLEYQAEMQARQAAVQLAGTTVGGILLGMLAMPYILFAWKAVLWDKVLSPVILGHPGLTEPLAGDVSSWGMSVVSLITGTVGASLIVNGIARRWTK